MPMRLKNKGQGQEYKVKLFNLKTVAAMTAFGLVGLIGTTETANAQGGRRNDDRQERRDDQQRRKNERAEAKAEQQRIALERQRQAYWNNQNSRIRAEQQRRAQWNNRNRSNGGVIFTNTNGDRNGRYRIYRNGSYYNTNYRGAELLQQAVNQGYQQGFQAGRNDRNNRRNVSWTNSNVYRTGNYGYQNAVSQSQYRYYFQQGFQRGYQDGSNSRYQDGYNGQYEYGYYDNGQVNILGTILGAILDIRSY